MRVHAAHLEPDPWKVGKGKFPKIRGTVIWGPYDKDPYYLGYYIRVPYFRNPPMILASTGFHTT